MKVDCKGRSTPAAGLAKRAGWIAALALASGAWAAPALAMQSTGQPTDGQPTDTQLTGGGLTGGGLTGGQPTGSQPADDSLLTQTSQPAERNVVENLLQVEDATILKSRLWVEGEWNNNENGASDFELTLGVRLGWQLSDNWDFAFQVEVPYRTITSDDASGNRDRGGLFDIKWNAGAAVRLSPTVRLGAGLEIRTPNGDDDVSLNIYRMQEYVTLAWDATPWLTLTPKVRYYHTIAHQEGGATQNYWEIFAPATFILPHRWSITTRYEVKFDQIADYTTHSAKFFVAHTFLNPALNVSLAFKIPFNSQTNDYQFVFNTTWFF